MGAVTDLGALAATLETGGPVPTDALLTGWLVRESVLLATGLLTATTGGLFWFLLSQKAASIRRGDQEVRWALGAACAPHCDRDEPLQPSPRTPGGTT